MAFDSDPFNDLVQLQERLAALLGVAQDNRALGSWPSGVYPPIDIFRGKDGAILRAEIPGVHRDDLTITVEGQQLTVSGERRPPEMAASLTWHRRERPFGKFSRSIRLPDDLDLHRMEAELRHGVLRLVVPMAEAAKPRQITINAA